MAADPVPQTDTSFKGIPEDRKGLYRIVIMNDRHGIFGANSSGVEYFTCYTPDKLSLKFESDWANVFDKMPGAGGTLDQINQFAKSVLGAELSDPSLTALVYKKTHPIRFNIGFQIVGNGPEEVRKALSTIIRMSVPTMKTNDAKIGGVIVPPGPSLAGYASGRIAKLVNAWVGEDRYGGLGQNISLAYGKKIFFPSIVIPKLEVDIPSRWTKDGDFTIASGTMTIATFTTPFAREISQILGLPDDPQLGDDPRL